jgi:cytochrome P450
VNGSSVTFGHAREFAGISGFRRFAADPLGSLTYIHRTYGGAARYQGIGRLIVILSEPALVEQVLVGSYASFFKDRASHLLDLALGQGLLTGEGQAWRRHRKVVAPSFQPGEVARYADDMAAISARWAARLEHEADAGPRDLYATMLELTLEIVVRTVFGAELQHVENLRSCTDAITEDFRELMLSWRFFTPAWLPLRARRRMRATRIRLHDLLDGLVAERRARPGRDVLSRLVAAAAAQPEDMSEAQLRDEAATLLLAGHETAALSLGHTLRLLAGAPEARVRLEEEVDGVLRDRLPTHADLPRLPWTRAVLQESLRLYPPAWGIGREAVAPVEIGGLPLRPGAQVLIPIWAIHRDEARFPDSEAFRPERWLGDLHHHLPRCAYMPFGAGPRTCVGNHFALLETTIVLAALARRVRLEPLTDQPWHLLPAATLRPRDPVSVQVVPRHRVPPGQPPAFAPRDPVR